METIKHRPSLNMHWKIKPVHIFYKIIGLATFSVRSVVSEKSSEVSSVFVSSKLGSYYNGVLTLVMIGTCYVKSPAILRNKDPNETAMTMGVRVVGWALGNLAVITILVSYCVNQADLVRIGNHLIDIERELRRVVHPVKRASSYLVIIAANLLNGFLELGIYSIEVFVFQSNPIDRLTDRVPQFLVCWFIIQYFSVMFLVNASFVDVNRALLGVSRNWSANFRPGPLRESRRIFVSGSTMQFVVQLRNLDERLCQVSTEISQFYSVPIVPSITHSFFRLSFMMYYLLVFLMMEKTRSDYWDISFSILVIVSFMHPVLSLSNKITNTMDEIATTGRTVHLLLNTAINKNLRTELKQFSLQLLHYGLEFTGNGYFTLDNTFVNSMTGVVFTYLVILIQFHLQSTSQTDNSCNCSINDQHLLDFVDNVSSVELFTYSP